MKRNRAAEAREGFGGAVSFAGNQAFFKNHGGEAGRGQAGGIVHAPGLMRIDGVKDGGAQLHWLPPLILRNADDTPTGEWKRIYGED